MNVDSLLTNRVSEPKQYNTRLTRVGAEWLAALVKLVLER